MRRLASVAIAITLQQLAAGKTSAWTDDQELVLRALRRSKASLNQASDGDLSDYVRSLAPEQLQGVASNVKGLLHEMLIKRAEDMDSDNVKAVLFEATNHPGADLEFFVDGRTIREVQAKAVIEPSAIYEHFNSYPDIDVLATSEVVEKLSAEFATRVMDSGFSNEELARMTKNTLEELAGENLDGVLQEGVMTSMLVAGALQAKAALRGQALAPKDLRTSLEAMGLATGTALTMEALLNLL